VVGGLLICGFPGLWWNHFRRPVLVDPTAMTWTVLASALSLHGWWPAALLVVLVAACMKETAPVFAACFALSPLLLLGLVAPLIRRVTARGVEELGAEELSDPIGSARRAHAAHVFDPVVMIAPWGVGVLAVLARDRTIVTVVTLAACLGYAQLAVAVNTVRLYQWAGPAVALATASVLPAGWGPAVLLLHLFNPLAGNGR
jgi:hypothetical protein